MRTFAWSSLRRDPQRKRFTGSLRPVQGRSRRDIALKVVLPLAAVALAVPAGWWLADRRSSEPAPRATTHLASLGPVQARVTGGWEPARAGVEPVKALAGLPSRAFGTYPGLDAYAVLALAPAEDPTLLPAALMKTVSGAIGKPVPGRVAGHSAWVYRSLPAGGRDRLMDVHVLPTTAGVLAVACVADRLSFSAVLDCGQRVQRVSVAGGQVLAPNPDLAMASQLGTVLPGFNRERARGRAALRGAKTRSGQSAAARSLIRTHRKAAGTLRPLATKGRPSGAVVGSLDDGAAAYGRLARAAANGWPGRFALARRAVLRAERALKRGLAALAPPSS
jgi:hypothetical protein